MSLYQLTQHGWPVGQWLIPTGTIIDDVNAKGPWSALVKSLRLPIPLNAMPLDRETWLEMKRQYPEHVHRILTPAGMVR
jgi:hypothetical protein